MRALQKSSTPNPADWLQTSYGQLSARTNIVFSPALGACLPVRQRYRIWMPPRNNCSGLAAGCGRPCAHFIVASSVQRVSTA
jgi:hypothetical protein